MQSIPIRQLPESNQEPKLVGSFSIRSLESILDGKDMVEELHRHDITSGKENMLALLFDMNSLWEEYVLTMLKAVTKEDLVVKGQESKSFWNGIKIRPDIVIHKSDKTFVIDTKWKNIGGYKPSNNDLRQMYVYNEYWGSNNALLLYPSLETDKPKFIPFEGDENHKCALGKLNILDGDKLNKNIGDEILEMLQTD